MSTTVAKIRKSQPSWQIPDFEVVSLSPKKHRYACCVFVINEGDKIKKQLKTMRPYSKQIDIIVADGGSTDNSLQTDSLRSSGVSTLLTKTGTGKLSAQMRMALAYAMYEGYEGVVVVDGNGKDDTSAIPAFIKLLNEGYDHIQGSRFIDGGHAINTPFQRLVAVRAIHAPLISLVSGRRQTDTTNGFRAYSRNLITDPNVSVFREAFVTYELHYYLAIESARNKKFRITETPVTRRYPKHGKTPTKISPIAGNAHIVAVLAKAAMGKYRPKPKRS